MGEQSICAHQECNCRLRQVVRNHLGCYFTRRSEIGAFKRFADGKSSSLARRRFVTQRTSPWKTARELANLLLNSEE
jgi:hypothetical protein